MIFYLILYSSDLNSNAHQIKLKFYPPNQTKSTSKMLLIQSARFVQVICALLPKFQDFCRIECHFRGIFPGVGYHLRTNLITPSAIPIDTTPLIMVPTINGG
jgi:hypothetical protein